MTTKIRLTELPFVLYLFVFVARYLRRILSSILPLFSASQLDDSSKFFIFRTCKAPLPQPPYNPHLQTTPRSANSNGLITPLESALIEVLILNNLKFFRINTY